MEPNDTTKDAARLQLELLRAMTPEERFRRTSELTMMIQKVAFAGMKRRHPDASDDEIWLRLAIDRLGTDVVKKIYGFEVTD
jgi:hypothetical protein